MEPSYTENHPGRATYLSGFVLALLLTLLAFILVCAESGCHLKPIQLVLDFLPGSEEAIKAMPRWIIVSGIFVLAVLQMAVHMRFFLHLDFSAGQRLNVRFILFALFIIFIVAGGTLWIMRDLNNRMLPVISG